MSPVRYECPKYYTVYHSQLFAPVGHNGECVSVTGPYKEIKINTISFSTLQPKKFQLRFVLQWNGSLVIFCTIFVSY